MFPAVSASARDALLTACAPLIWGSTYWVTSQWLPPDRPLTAAVLRVLPAGLLLLLWARQWPAAGQWRRIGGLAVLNIAVFQALLFVAAYRLPGGVAAILGATQPLLVLGWAWLLDGRRPAGAVVAAAGLGVAGMALLLNAPGAHWDELGVLAAALGALSMACGSYLTGRWQGCRLPVLALTGWQLTLGGLCLAPLAWALEPPLPALTAAQGLAYGYLSVFGTLLAYVLWFRGIVRLPAVAVSSLGLLSPLSAAVIGALALGQWLRGWALAGWLLTLGSVLGVQWLERLTRPVDQSQENQ